MFHNRISLPHISRQQPSTKMTACRPTKSAGWKNCICCNKRLMMNSRYVYMFFFRVRKLDFDLYQDDLCDGIFSLCWLKPYCLRGTLKFSLSSWGERWHRTADNSEVPCVALQYGHSGKSSCSWLIRGEYAAKTLRKCFKMLVHFKCCILFGWFFFKEM